MSDLQLCVNIDHIATVRQARKWIYPDIIEAARVCEDNGAVGITVHLREDRRHIQDNDVYRLRETVKGKLNLEMALSDNIIAIAKKVRPDQITLVPEKREELTTEGGLDVKKNYEKIKDVIAEFHELGVQMSLFIEPDIDAVQLSRECEADYIEIHTGAYCELVAYNKNGKNDEKIKEELERMLSAAKRADELNLGINAGHGLDYDNIVPILSIPKLQELNIGYSIISHALFVGLKEAVTKMVAIIS